MRYGVVDAVAEPASHAGGAGRQHLGVGRHPHRTGASDRAVLALGIRKLVVICPALIAEVEEVLVRRPRLRKWIAPDVAERYVETLRVLADVVPDPAGVSRRPRVTSMTTTSSPSPKNTKLTTS